MVQQNHFYKYLQYKTCRYVDIQFRTGEKSKAQERRFSAFLEIGVNSVKINEKQLSSGFLQDNSYPTNSSQHSLHPHAMSVYGMEIVQ